MIIVPSHEMILPLVIKGIFKNESENLLTATQKVP